MKTHLARKLTLFLTVGAALFGGSAIAAQVYLSDNTPEKGYLLCANNKTKAVTYPKKLSCPTVVCMNVLFIYGNAILSHLQNGSNRFLEYAFSFSL